MSFSHAIDVGMAIPPIIGAVALAVRYTYFALQKKPRTVEEKHGAVYDRLHARYRAEGHENPHRAASERMMLHHHLDEFRRFAQVEYVRASRSLDEIKTEWLKTRSKAIREVMEIGNDKAGALYYLKILKGALDQEDEATIFQSGESAAKWKAEKAKQDAEIERYMKVDFDPISAAVIEEMYAAGNRI